MSNYDLTFHYPPGWTLVATGKPYPVSKPLAVPTQAPLEDESDQVGHWISERPIPIAGFDLGKYVKATAQAGSVHVETYATIGVERDFPNTPDAPPQVETVPSPSRRKMPQPLPSAALPLSPARNAAAVAESTAQAIRYYADRFSSSSLTATSLLRNFPGARARAGPASSFYPHTHSSRRMSSIRFT